MRANCRKSCTKDKIWNIKDGVQLIEDIVCAKLQSDMLCYGSLIRLPMVFTSAYDLME